MLSPIKIKWNKSDYTLEVDLSQDLSLLRTQLFSLTGVLPEKQKILMKGKVLNKEDQSLSEAGVKPGGNLMLMGTASELVESKEEVKYQDELTPEEKARAYREREGIAMPVGLVNLGNTCYMNSTVRSWGVPCPPSTPPTPMTSPRSSRRT